MHVFDYRFLKSTKVDPDILTRAVNIERRRNPLRCSDVLPVPSGGRIAPFGQPCSHRRQFTHSCDVICGLSREKYEKNRSRTP